MEYTMENTSDRIKGDIINSNTIKTKLVQSGIWTASNIAPYLQEDTEIESVDINDRDDKLFLKVKDSYLIDQNTLNVANYLKVSNMINRMIDDKRSDIKEVLNDQEKEYLESKGTYGVLNNFYSLAPIKAEKTIVVEL
jgi:hypothetical protein